MSWYSIIPSEILSRKDLKANEKLVIGIIISLSHLKGHCFASNQYIGDCVGLSDEAIRKIVKALEDKGIIKRLVVRKANGEMESRDLRMATPLVYSYPPSGTTIPDPPVQPYQTSGIDIPHNNKENIKENIKVTNITDDRFEKFWKTYDKEIEKDRCYGKWKFLSSLEKDKILATIEAYIESKPDPTYRLNPYRYLSNRSWNDAIIKSNVSTEPLKIKEINNSAFEINVPDGW